jgi:hypothetical protein
MGHPLGASASTTFEGRKHDHRDIALNEPAGFVPVTCPNCGADNLQVVAPWHTAAALTKGLPLPLECPCGAVWLACEAAREQIRDYLATLYAADPAGGD